MYITQKLIPLGNITFEFAFKTSLYSLSTFSASSELSAFGFLKNDVIVV